MRTQHLRHWQIYAFCCRALLAALLAALSGCALLQPQPLVEPEPVLAAPPPQPVEDPRIDEIQEQLTTLDQHLQDIVQQLNDLKTSTTAALAAQPIEKKAPPAAMPLPLLATPGLHPDGKTVVGKIEWLWVQSFKESIPAVMSTSTLLSFIHVSDLNLYERDGNRWAKFTLSFESSKKAKAEKQLSLAAPVERLSRSKARHSDASGSRPVIKLPVRLGNLQQITEFVLTEESFGKQPIALGRNFLKDMAVVDVSEQYMQKKYAPPQEPKPEATNQTTDARGADEQ